MLINYGNDNETPKILNVIKAGFTAKEDLMGKTPLHYAAEKGHINVCKILINHTEEKK